MQTSRVFVVGFLSVLAVCRAQVRIQACLQNNVDIDINSGAERTFRCPAAEMAAALENSTADQLQLTIRVDSADITTLDEDFQVFTTYGDLCTAPQSQLSNIQTANQTFEGGASCRETTGTCQRENIPIAPPEGDDLCVRIFCENANLDCDLNVFMDVFEPVNPAEVLCSHQRTFSLPFYDNEEEFECGGGFFNSVDFESATLTYSVRANNDADEFTVWHGNGDSCGEDIDSPEFRVIQESSCATDPVRSCAFEDVAVGAAPDCIIVRCENEVTTCDVSVDIVWTGEGAQSRPILFVALLAVFFTFFSQ